MNRAQADELFQRTELVVAVHQLRDAQRAYMEHRSLPHGDDRRERLGRWVAECAERVDALLPPRPDGEERFVAGHCFVCAVGPGAPDGPRWDHTHSYRGDCSMAHLTEDDS